MTKRRECLNLTPRAADNPTFTRRDVAQQWRLEKSMNIEHHPLQLQLSVVCVFSLELSHLDNLFTLTFFAVLPTPNPTRAQLSGKSFSNPETQGLQNL